MVSDEKARLEEQKARLGPEGLAAAGEKVKAAIASKQLPPQSVLESVPVANAANIKFRTMRYFNYTTDEQPEEFPLKTIPFRFHLDDIQTQFVKMNLFFNTTAIKQEDRPYLVSGTIPFFSLMLELCPTIPEDHELSTLQIKFVQEHYVRKLAVVSSFSLSRDEY